MIGLQSVGVVKADLQVLVLKRNVFKHMWLYHDIEW